MVYYEIKKIFAGTGNRIVLLALLVLLAVVSYFAVTGVTYINEQGEEESGLSGIRKLREARQEWAGELTTEHLERVIEENNRIVSTPQYGSKNVTENNIAYSWGQGISDIRELLNCAFCEFREYDHYRANSLTPSDAADFYPNRIMHLKKWLESEDAKYRFSKQEKAFLVNQYEKLQTPLNYQYSDGFEQLFEFSPTIIMILVLILSFILSNLFSGEFRQKADAVFFTAKYGRNRAIKAKIAAGLAVTTVIYFVVLLAYSGIVLGILGADGASCPIQVRMDGWKSFYNITNRQEYLLILFGGYIGTVFMLLLTMLVSAKFQSPVLAVMVSFVLIFLPSFLSNIYDPVIDKIIGLLPDQLLQMNMAVAYFNLYTLGNSVVGAVQILPFLYTALAVPVCLLLYRTYKKSGQN